MSDVREEVLTSETFLNVGRKRKNDMKDFHSLKCASFLVII